MKLDKESQRLFDETVEAYQIEETSALQVLRVACEALTQLRKAEKQVAKEGQTVTDRFGQLRKHPLTDVVRDCRNQILRSFQILNLEWNEEA